MAIMMAAVVFLVSGTVFVIKGFKETAEDQAVPIRDIKEFKKDKKAPESFFPSGEARPSLTGRSPNNKTVPQDQPPAVPLQPHEQPRAPCDSPGPAQ